MSPQQQRKCQLSQYSLCHLCPTVQVESQNKLQTVDLYPKFERHPKFERYGSFQKRLILSLALN